MSKDTPVKRIEDYLHYYLGCDVLIWHDISDCYSFSGLDAILLHSILIDAKPDRFKPVLRPLSSMTEEEVGNVVEIMLGKKPDQIAISWSDDRNFCVCIYKEEEIEDDQRYDKVVMEIHISNIGSPFTIYNCWQYIKGNGTGQSQQPLYNSHEITHYLLSKGFDIFGLCEAGLAIDKTQQ